MSAPLPRGSRLIAMLTATAFGLSAHAAPPSPAPPAADHLERGRVCFFALDLACAERELTLAHTSRDTLPEASRVSLLALLAELHLSAERPDTARAHLVELLTLQPTFAPSWPPPWLQTLDEARRLAPDKLPPTFEGSADLPASAPASAPLIVSAEVFDPSGLSRVELVIARLGTPELRLALSTTDGVRWSVRVAPELTAKGRTTLQLQAWDRHGNGPATWPAKPHPLELTAVDEPPDTTPITARWWFWATLVGVTGLAVVLGLALAEGSEAPATSGDLGITLELP